MPFGNNDWLALTQEDPIEPEIPLCDPTTISGTGG